jgi:nucleotide-binding universal stress UspA family protein
MIEKILVAFDSSEPANKALDFAVDIAEKYSAEILILSVIQPAITPVLQYPQLGVPAPPPVAMSPYIKEVKDQHRKIISEAKKRIQKTKPNLNVTTKLLEGRPSDTIVETAEQGKFSLIVIGSQGLGGVKKFLLGSVSDRVADQARCPVLIVK